MSQKYVYLFKEGNAQMKSLLGGKGANLAEMSNAGLPVPPGFTVSTKACKGFYDNNEKLNEEMLEQIYESLEILQQQTKKSFGERSNPLLVSVRSGAAISMPGMMDTILNLGLNDETVVGIADKTDNMRFAYDSYRRFIQMFSDVVLEIPKFKFENVLDKRKEDKGYENDTDLTTHDLKDIVEEFKKIVKKETKKDFPQDPKEQLLLSIEAVFKSWNNARARAYRNLYDIAHDIGTAVNVQSMVFGNMGDDSGTGVAFTRNPATGEKKLYGEFLMNAQGEDVVAGIRTPKEIATLKEIMPKAYDQFVEIVNNLETHYKDMQDIEFTIEKENLYILQTRNGKRTAPAALKVAVDMVKEGLITEEEAILRVEAKQLDQLLHPTFDPKTMETAESLTKGLPASPGAATGKIYFSAEDCVEAKERGETVILVRKETSPEDIEGMNVAKGILTSRGGMTSHAAVVARGMGKCCVAGCEWVKVDEEKKTMTVGDVVLTEGDSISLDGTTGKVYVGEIKTVDPELSGDFAQLMEWADKRRVLGVRTNADTPKDAKAAISFGAEGIGLCRTEHMFFEEDRIPVVREMILSKTKESREKALKKLLPMQKKDFKGLFQEMIGKPVTIRLLDPPLHEFLPTDPKDIESLAAEMNVTVDQLKDVINELHEFNPMLGHRGCRLAITYPEIAEMQTQAIIEAAIEVNQEMNATIIPEIMIPLVGIKKEVEYVKEMVLKTAEKSIKQNEASLSYLVGTMIEIPRATLISDKIAEEVDFFSFGTNDLTQMTFGFSRDDAGKFISEYREQEILPEDPFQSIDVEGVGKL
ncbi:MAG TPA: pyruvate, phosphate dikinase, partial [Eubacteriaceae bacterium]|nr:pyruvate, phosphate dikinase [Eubacteriaceae bacterium]